MRILKLLSTNVEPNVCDDLLVLGGAISSIHYSLECFGGCGMIPVRRLISVIIGFLWLGFLTIEEVLLVHFEGHR